MADAKREVLVNAHDAITLFYSLLMAAALRESLVNLFYLTPGRTLKQLSELGAPELAMFVVFLLLMTRFFIGNIRHLDATYKEPFARSDPDLTAAAPSNRLFDFGWLVFQAVIFFYMGAAVTDVTLFVTLFVFLLVVDVIWLLFSSLRTGNVRDDDGALTTEIVWSINNTVHVGVIAVLYALIGSASLVSWWPAFALVGISNSVLDFSLTWQHYFPPVEDAT